MSQTFRIVTWNIERGIKFDEIARILLDDVPADIYALQEVDLHARRSSCRDVCADLAAHLGMHYIYGIEFREFAQEGCGSKYAYHGQAFISEFQCNHSETLYFPHQFKDRSLRWFHKPIIASSILHAKLMQTIASVDLGYTVANLFQPRSGRRMALFGEFELGDRKLFVYNTHLEWYVNDTERAAQMQDIIEDTYLRVSELDAVVILGDFNTELGADSLVIKRAQEHGFVDAMSSFESRNARTCDNDQRLDWILVKNLKAVSGYVYPDGFDASDHLPVIVELEFV